MQGVRSLAIRCAAALILAWSAGPAFGGERDHPAYVEYGEASWYGPGFEGKETASGETFDQNRLTAAHLSLPFGTKVKVTNLENGKSGRVEVNDRGPYVRGRAIDLSKAAARKLDMVEEGTALVRIEASRQDLERATNAVVASRG
jgi:rare lipoprotein A